MQTTTIDSALLNVPNILATFTPPEETVVQKLERLAVVRSELADREAIKQNFIDDHLALYHSDLSVMDSLIAKSAANASLLESEIKDAVIASGSSVKSLSLQAVYSKPRETWEGAKLSAYAIACPEILAFRKVGQPSVSIREVK